MATSQVFLKDFLLFFAPKLYEEVDFSKGYEFLEQELTQLFQETENRKKFMDKLVKVYLKDGIEKWMLVHIEVQGDRKEDFSKRMFQYFYRTLDKYDKNIYALALFTDASPTYKPNDFYYSFYDTKLTYKYNVYKIIEQDDEQLANSNNPFALVIIAGIYAIRSKRYIDQKFSFKLKLARQLLSKDWEREQIEKLFCFIDGMIRLEADLGLKFKQEVDKIIKLKGDNFMGLSWDKTNLAEIYWNKGMEKGLEKGKLDIAKQMISKGFPQNEILELTGLTDEEIEKLKTELEI